MFVLCRSFVVSCVVSFVLFVCRLSITLMYMLFFSFCWVWFANPQRHKPLKQLSFKVIFFGVCFMCICFVVCKLYTTKHETTTDETSDASDINETQTPQKKLKELFINGFLLRFRCLSLFGVGVLVANYTQLNMKQPPNK